jgi:hypothetical protein
LSFERLFHPKGIAIIGASADLGRIGGHPIKALKNAGYKGGIFPINPKYPELHGLACFPDVMSLKDPCDLAVVAVPAPGVAKAIRDCGKAGIPFAVVLTAGFRETGAEGRKLEAELKVAVAESGVRIVGPNCQGMLSIQSRVFAAFGSTLRIREGHVVTPGFIDAHIHPVTSGLEMGQCDLNGARGLEAYLERVAAYAAAYPDRPWILGGGWTMSDFPGGIPRREDLDRVVSDRPIALSSRDGHTMWLNGRALEVAGIRTGTVDPPGGRIERDPDGTPIGALQEAAAEAVEAIVPPPTEDDLVEALVVAQAHLHALGVTGWQDAIVTPDVEEIAYRTLAGRGRLTSCVVGALWWERSRGEEQIDELIERRAHTAVGRYAPTSVKLMLDGVLENMTGAVLEPYLGPDGRPTANRGIAQIDPEALGGYVTQLDRLGFQAHFHAIGERAVRDALDAVATARLANGPNDTRPHISHIQLIHPDDIGRFAELDAVANAQPYWACHSEQMDVLTIPLLGAERSGWQYPFRSLLAAGARLAMGSDWSVSTANPLLEMEVAVNRVSDEDRGERPAFLPAERLELIDAIAAFTMGSAFVNHLEDEVGSLEVGKAADLVILDRDLFDRRAGAIGEASVMATFIDGVPVFEAANLEA